MLDRLAPVQPSGIAAPAPATRAPLHHPAGTAFADVLAGKLEPAGPLRFSGHAAERLQSRGIGLDATGLARLEDGVAKAAAKGGRDSLVLMDGTAYVVSVPNRTVITAVDQAHMRDHVFTNIDSAVIA